MDEWRADQPDMTKILSSIGRDCREWDTCGAACCPPENTEVQLVREREWHIHDEQTILDDLIRQRKEQPMSGNAIVAHYGHRVNAYGRTYSLYPDIPGNGTVCSYSIGFYDPLYQQVYIWLHANLCTQANHIYFHCPQNTICCGLTCYDENEQRAKQYEPRAMSQKNAKMKSEFRGCVCDTLNQMTVHLYPSMMSKYFYSLLLSFSLFFSCSSLYAGCLHHIVVIIPHLSVNIADPSRSMICLRW